MNRIALIALIAATAAPALANETSIAARDIGDRAENIQVSELSTGERNGKDLPQARDIGDRAERVTV